MDLLELLKGVAPVLGVILPAIGAYFAYRMAEGRKGRDPAVQAASLAAAGSALADRPSVEAMNNLAAAIEHLAAESRDRGADERRFRQADRLLEELIELRRAADRVAFALERRPAA